ncbi:hypothetical protein H6G08_11990 [Calothrix anomala FACHB-343]|uniref:Uncharacterized protein n=2 Tax=Calothrix TaxID=1186 RepID=A0ABR8A8S0_9CYAN|nr:MULTISPECIES: hypothetical protein [Calothrix]MBD2196386.1 hypothetical protein [Calothrix parietina FACHB-288]MBD2225218.1 hypothetical protein [Calothrix anomala FACHB-343]
MRQSTSNLTVKISDDWYTLTASKQTPGNVGLPFGKPLRVYVPQPNLRGLRFLALTELY